jgi:hypothetical protein
MVRRIAKIILLSPALNGNYEQCSADAYDWKPD